MVPAHRIANGKVIAWQWCNTENAAAWNQLLHRLPEPQILITDGGVGGLLKTLNDLWPEVMVQPCLVHLQRTVKQYVSSNPKTAAGKSLRELSLNHTKVKSIEDAEQWVVQFNDWYDLFKEFINERRYAQNHMGPLPAGIGAHHVWWYAHKPVRSAYHSLRRVLQREHLFTFLSPQLTGLGVSATTNMIERAINSGIRATLFHHRGMTTEHQRRAVEWFCWAHADQASRPSLSALIVAEHYQPVTTTGALAQGGGTDWS